MHGLGLPRVPVKHSTNAATTPNKDTWEKPRASGTLESIVNQATTIPHRGKSPFFAGGGMYGNVLVPWLDPQRAAAISATTNGMTMDALVPCSNPTKEQRIQTMDSISRVGIGTYMVGGPTPVGSCSAAPAATQEEGALVVAAAVKRGRVAHVVGSGRGQSVSGSGTFGRQSEQVTLDTYEREFGMGGFTSTSIASLDNTSSEKQCTKTTVDDHDSVCHSRPTVSVSHDCAFVSHIQIINSYILFLYKISINRYIILLLKLVLKKSILNMKLSNRSIDRPLMGRVLKFPKFTKIRFIIQPLLDRSSNYIWGIMSSFD